MSSGLRENLTRGSTWLRGLYMLLFAVLFNITEIVLAAVAVFQFLAQLLTGGVNQRVQNFGDQLATYLREMGAFLAYASSHKPFPFGPWPGTREPDAAEGGPMGPGTEPAAADTPDTEPTGTEATDTDDEDDEPNEAGVR
jgi:hypothetical protein